MKKDEVPERIYLYERQSDKSLGDDWLSKRSDRRDLEYIRTDVFIQRVKDAFCMVKCMGQPPRSTCTSLGTCKEYDNFVKCVKMIV